MKTKVSKSQHKHDDSQDLETKPSKNKQTRKAEYIRSDKTEIYYYGRCPECGKEGQLNQLGEDIWGYCEEHNAAWYIPRNHYDPKGGPEFCRLVDERGYIKVAPIMSSLESPENKVAMLEEMQAISINPTSEIHLVDQDIQIKECFSLHPLPDGCTVQVRFREHLSCPEQMKRLRLIKNQIENQMDDCPF